MMRTFWIHVVAALALSAPGANAQSTAPAGSMPLSSILESVEAGGDRTIFSADFHRSNWEVVSCQGRSRICREDVIDPATGEVRRSETELVARLPPRGALSASEIVRRVEAMNAGNIGEIEFDDRRWEVELWSSRLARTELRIDPISGNVTRCEGRACG